MADTLATASGTSATERGGTTKQGFDEWYGFPHSSAETLNNIQPGYSADIPPN
jgi:hypothetical protein